MVIDKLKASKDFDGREKQLAPSLCHLCTKKLFAKLEP